MSEQPLRTTILGLWLAVSGVAAAQEQRLAPPAGQPSALLERASAARGGHAAAALDRRIAAYTRILDLDAKQQAQLRTLLLQQHAQVRRLWSDSSIPAAERVLGTRAIEDATADHIRAMLSEEQVKKYNAPRVPRPKGAQDPLSVEQWMNAVEAH